MWDENARRIDGDLPTAAVVPVMKRKSFKELGTPTAQAAALADKVLSLPEAELLQRAEARRQELVEAGELDEVADNQPLRAPPLDSLVPRAGRADVHLGLVPLHLR